MEPVVNFPCRIVWKLGKTIKFRISIDVSSLSSRYHTVIFRFFAIAIWRYISFSDLTNPNAHGPVRTKSDFAYIGPQQWIIDIMMIYEYLWWFVNFMIYPNLINLADAKSYGSKSTSFIPCGTCVSRLPWFFAVQAEWFFNMFQLQTPKTIQGDEVRFFFFRIGPSRHADFLE